MAPVDAGTEASRRMHEYLISKQRKQEEYWLRKYGKILQPGPPSLGKMPSNSRLPPLSGGGSGTSLPDTERSSGGGAGGSLSRDPSAGSGLLPPIPGAQPTPPAAGFLPHHRHQPKGHAPIFHANEPVKDFFGRNARQPRGSAVSSSAVHDEYGNVLPPSHRPPEPFRKPYPAQLPPMGGEYSYGVQSPMEGGERATSAPDAWLTQQQQQQYQAQQSYTPQQEPSSPYNYRGQQHGQQYGQPSPQALHRQQQQQQRAAQVLGRLPPLQHEPSGPRGGALRGGSSGGGSSPGPGNKPLRNLEMELSVIRTIKAREDVLERLRIAGGKLDSGFGGRAPVVLSPVDPLVRLFYRLVGTLRQRTLDVVEAIAAWRRKVSPSEPFIYYGVDYLAAIGPDVGFLDELPFLRTRLTFGKAANDPFLAEVTPDGIPIEEATTCDLRRGGQRFSSDALRIRMARKVLAQYCGRPLGVNTAGAGAGAAEGAAADLSNIADIPSEQLFAELSQPRSVHSYTHSALGEASVQENEEDLEEAEEAGEPGPQQKMRAVTPPTAATAQAGLLPSLVRAITPPAATEAGTAAAAPSPQTQVEVSGDGEDEEEEREEEAREREREREAEQYFSGEEEGEQEGEGPEGGRRPSAAEESPASQDEGREQEQEEGQQQESAGLYMDQEEQQKQEAGEEGEVAGGEVSPRRGYLAGLKEGDDDAAAAAADAVYDTEVGPEAGPQQQTDEDDLLVFEDDNDYIDFALGAIIRSLEPPYTDAIKPGTFTIAGWEIDQQLEEVLCGIASPSRQAPALSVGYDADGAGAATSTAAPPTPSRASGRIPFPPADVKPPSRGGSSSRPASRGSRIPAPPPSTFLSASAASTAAAGDQARPPVRVHLRPNSRGLDMGLSMDMEGPAPEGASEETSTSTSGRTRPPVRVHLRPNSREQLNMGLSIDSEDLEAAGAGAAVGAGLPAITEDRSAYFGGNTDTEGNDGIEEDPADGGGSGDDDGGGGLPYDDGDLASRPPVRVHLRPNSRGINMGLSMDDDGLGPFPSANMRYGVTSVVAAADAVLQGESSAADVTAAPALPPLNDMPLPLQGPLSARSNRASIRSARQSGSRPSSATRPTSPTARESVASWGGGADE